MTIVGQEIPIPAIAVTDLHKSYGSLEAVRGVTFAVEPGEVFGLLGPNGAGKTTIVEILEGYRTRDSGDVTVLGMDPRRGGRALRERVGLVLQDPRFALNPVHTVGRQVEEPLLLHGNFAKAERRERALEMAQKYPDRLRIELDALVTRVLLDESNRATGVEYLKGERLYRAHGQPATAEGELHQAQATHEVILCGGAFNTPQLLMLSGIGRRDVLEPLGIPVKVELPGVGKNLQDRYEVGVVNRMSFDRWNILEGVTFSHGDPAYRDWADKREGLYTSNGAVLAAILKSRAERPLPDLFCFALVGLFGGYFPGYSSLAVTKPNYLTWAILKAHTENRAGEVALRSADPRDTPLINFHYFEEGSDKAGEDLDSVVAGIRFVRRLTAKLKAEGAIAEEEAPGEARQSDDELKDYVRSAAWGHHASCTCPIGPRETGGVLSGDFRVHGTQGLRIVDASVFPRIPGFFIVSAVYMIAEKAADVILAS